MVSGEIPVETLQFFDVLNKLFSIWNDNKFSGCYFIDFLCACGNIDHTILAEKLKLYGFDNTPLKLVVNYMSYHKQSTVVNGQAPQPMVQLKV